MTQNIKTLVFECYKLVDPMEQATVTFWGWCPTNQLSDLTVTFFVSYI
jgi:hypothetical protein